MSLLNTVLPHLSPEGATVHAQFSCGFLLPVSAASECLPDLLCFLRPEGSGSTHIFRSLLSPETVLLQIFGVHSPPHGGFIDRLTGPQSTDPFDQVLQFSDIPVERIPRQAFRRRPGNLRHCCTLCQTLFSQQMREYHLNVMPPPAKRAKTMIRPRSWAGPTPSSAPSPIR